MGFAAWHPFRWCACTRDANLLNPLEYLARSLAIHQWGAPHSVSIADEKPDLVYLWPSAAGSLDQR
jgi:hypothetical protein